MTNSIINWDNIFAQKESFMNAQPFKFAFIENIFEKNFYEKLYDTYPKIDDSWSVAENMYKNQLVKSWGDSKNSVQVSEGPDSKFSNAWNELKLYAESEEFISNMRKFSGTTVNKLKDFLLLSYQKGGFQLPHIHNVGPNTLVMLFYFSKGWGEGDAGGTYIASEPDESKIIFEPYNLNNTMALFQDSPKAAHGVRMISKDVERRGLQIVLEEFDEETGWTGVDPHSDAFKSQLPEI